jgi:hypothetical protein
MTTQRLLSSALASAALALLALGSPSPALAQPAQFYPLTPCRVIDTRLPTPNPLTGGSTRSFTVKGQCGVPSDAKAISYNLTAIQASSQGHFRIFPHGVTLPDTSAINFPAGVNIANGGVVAVAAGTPDLSLFLNAGSANAALDVTGYFK